MRDFCGNRRADEVTSADMEQEIAADAVDLVRVFQDVLERLRERPVLDVNEEAVTVAQMIDYVKRRLMMEDRPVSLRRLLHSTHSERALICMFLAMLELVRLQAVLLHQPLRTRRHSDQEGGWVRSGVCRAGADAGRLAVGRSRLTDRVALRCGAGGVKRSFTRL